MRIPDQITAIERIVAEATERLWNEPADSPHLREVRLAVADLADAAMHQLVALPRNGTTQTLVRMLLTGTSALEIGASANSATVDWLVDCIPTVIEDERMIEHYGAALELVVAHDPAFAQRFFEQLDGVFEGSFGAVFPSIDARLVTYALDGLMGAQPDQAPSIADSLVARVPVGLPERAAAELAAEAITAHAVHSVLPLGSAEPGTAHDPSPTTAAAVAEVVVVRATALLAALHADGIEVPPGDLRTALAQSPVAAANARFLVQALGEVGLAGGAQELARCIELPAPFPNQPDDLGALVRAIQPGSVHARADVGLRNLAWVFALAGATQYAAGIYRAAGHPARAKALEANDAARTDFGAER